jgi:F420-0:gamma-glutamyl ligase
LSLNLGRRAFSKMTKLGHELIHCVTTLTFIDNMCGAAFLERGEAGDRIDIVLVEDVDAVETKDILGT